MGTSITNGSQHHGLEPLELLPYINHCDGAIFTMPEFVGHGLKVPVYQVMPCIDPLAEKNRDYNEHEALAILDPLFNVYGVDPDRPIFLDPPYLMSLSGSERPD